MPFYTRLWKETDGTLTSSVVNMRSVTIPDGVEKTWDENTKQYYIEYEQNGTTYKMWIEDEESLKAKLNLVNQYDLAGGAFWSKDRESNTVWGIIADKLNIKETKENISLDDIFEVICKEFNVKSADVKSNKKTSNIVKIKRIIIFLARELTTVSTPQLARVFSMKDHTSISHNIKKIREEIEKDNELQARINELKNKILIKRRNESEIM